MPGDQAPGFNKDKMRMSAEEKAKLSGVELEAQQKRKATIDEAHKRYSQSREGSPYAGSVEETRKGVAGEIINEARDENLQRAQEAEGRVARGMDVNNMSAKDKEALVAAQKKVEDAFNLKEKGKN
jgi:hypothetical protein